MSAVKVNGRTAEAKAFRVERVVKATRELASAGGYEAVQMREVARVAQTALSTLYKYYASKDDLITVAVRSELDSLAEDFPPSVETADGGGARRRSLRAGVPGDGPRSWVCTRCDVRAPNAT
ncbi:hypothetical protein GCM10020255_044490 [Rhodococcus baikonurensis]